MFSQLSCRQREAGMRSASPDTSGMIRNADRDLFAQHHRQAEPVLFSLNTSLARFREPLKASSDLHHTPPVLEAYSPPSPINGASPPPPTLGNTHIPEVAVQQLHVSVQHLQGEQLVIALVQTGAEIQAGVPAGGEGPHGGGLYPRLHCVVCFYAVFPLPVYGERAHKGGGGGGGVPPLSLSWLHLLLNWP